MGITPRTVTGISRQRHHQHHQVYRALCHTSRLILPHSLTHICININNINSSQSTLTMLMLQASLPPPLPQPLRIIMLAHCRMAMDIHTQCLVSPLT